MFFRGTIDLKAEIANLVIADVGNLAKVLVTHTCTLKLDEGPHFIKISVRYSLSFNLLLI